ncbi:LacI family DNA-binding transcriptional regulator [Rhodoluna sp.]|uniref:LacI family DNA-binding transcriptional regulator n=1 Tax=Rhodoluna sp. TaxID=1969481 RepID=UPI0025D056EB|nr:LacI family DNA-binding transcriptional regulator [Rhodoluna sp.]
MKTNKRPTIRDVAAEAGVSKSLVSMVFSSDEGVSQARRDKVMAAAKKLGFTPNVWARSLSSGLSNFIAILVVDLHNPLFTEVADHARKALLERGHQTFMTAAIISMQNGKRVLEKSTVQTLLDLKPRGILVIGDLPDKASLKQVPEEVPIVIATTVHSGLKRAIVLRIDEDEAMRQIVQHLVEKGHQTVSYVGPDDSDVSTARISSFKKAMDLYKLTPHMQFCDRTEEAGYSAAKIALQGEPQPTALICFNDVVAFGVQEAVESFQKAGGGQVAVTGFDNTYISALSRISLTSIEQEKVAIAMRAAEILSADESVWREAEGKNLLLVPRLVIRDSSNFVQP